MDYSEIVEIRECDSQESANILLDSQEEHWILLETATGQSEKRKPIFRYSLGRKSKTGRVCEQWLNSRNQPINRDVSGKTYT